MTSFASFSSHFNVTKSHFKAALCLNPPLDAPCYSRPYAIILFSQTQIKVSLKQFHPQITSN